MLHRRVWRLHPTFDSSNHIEKDTMPVPIPRVAWPVRLTNYLPGFDSLNNRDQLPNSHQLKDRKENAAQAWSSLHFEGDLGCASLAVLANIFGAFLEFGQFSYRQFMPHCGT